jgi:hypothetical protein
VKFKSQSLLIITVETGYSGLGSATVKRILFEKPNGSKGYWDATVSGTTLTYQTTNSDIDQVGLWKFHSYIEVGGLKAYGDITTQYFGKPLI